MSIAIGDKTYQADNISRSNGTAFVRSGELFDTLKKQKTTLAINSDNPNIDSDINLVLRLGLTFMDN